MLALFLVIGAASHGSASAPLEATQRPAAVDALFKEFNQKTTPGLALGIYQNGQPVLTRAYGMADLENPAPITTDAVFHVASVSKHFTAFAVLLLANEGKVDLDADVRRYLPYMPDFGDVITVRHLIYHTSGLRDSWRLFALGGVDSYSHRQQSQVVNMVSRQRGLNFKPGTEYAYSNMNYTLLAEVVRSVTGKTLRQFTTERMFKPLQMDHTFFADDILEIVPRRAQSYSREGDTWRRSPLNLDTYGATNLQTTVKDFARWADNFARPKVGDRALLAQFTSMGKLDDGTPLDYGFALHSETFLGRSAVAHTGADAGFRAIFAYFPAEDFAIALLSNSSLSESSYIEPLVEIYLGAKDGATRKPSPPPRNRTAATQAAAAPTLAALRELEGDYRSSELDATYTLAVKEQTLTLNSIWFDEPMLLKPTGEDAFLTDWPVERIRVERDARGRVTAILSSSGSARNVRFERQTKTDR